MQAQETSFNLGHKLDDPTDQAQQNTLEKQLTLRKLLEDIFSSDPARDVSSPRRWTYRHAVAFGLDEELRYFESRQELIAALFLDHQKRLGTITNWKSQPATFEIDGHNYTPDFIFTVGEKTYVVEIKSERYVSRAVERELVKTRNWFNKQGLGFLLWTDSRIITTAVHHNYLRLWCSANHVVDPCEIETVVEFVRTRRSTTMFDCIEARFGMDLVCIAIYQGKLHAALNKPIDCQTRVALAPNTDFLKMALNAMPSSSKFWDLLNKVAEGAK